MILPLEESPLVPLPHPAALRAGVNCYVKRDDLYTLAPGTALQGNKVRKLLPILQRALRATSPPLLVSFGGAFSNHLSALATAGRHFRLPVVLFVRGEEVDNPVLRQAAKDGARLIRLSRQAYRQKHLPEWQAAQRPVLLATGPPGSTCCWFIPEGGTTAASVAQLTRLPEAINLQLGRPPDYLCLSAGTGGTAAGVIAGAARATRIEVFPALKGEWMAEEIRRWLPEKASASWSCQYDYHLGGYGKFPAAWIKPAPGLAKRADIGPDLPPLEPIYTAKLFAAVLQRIQQGCYPRGSTLVLLHTGGIY